MGYFSRPGDFKKWFIAYHKEQTNEERWRGLQITYTQAPEDTGRWKRGGALMAFQQSAKHSLEYRQCHLPEVRSSVCYRCLSQVPRRLAPSYCV